MIEFTVITPNCVSNFEVEPPKVFGLKTFLGVCTRFSRQLITATSETAHTSLQAHKNIVAVGARRNGGL